MADQVHNNLTSAEGDTTKHLEYDFNSGRLLYGYRVFHVAEVKQARGGVLDEIGRALGQVRPSGVDDEEFRNYLINKARRHEYSGGNSS